MINYIQNRGSAVLKNRVIYRSFRTGVQIVSPSHVGASVISLAPTYFISQSALMLLLLLSKSQPLTLGCDLVLGANLAAAASILVWVPPPKGGFTLRRLQCSGQVNCPCANGFACAVVFVPIVLPPGGRFAIITVSRDSKTSSAAVRMYAAAAV